MNLNLFSKSASWSYVIVVLALIGMLEGCRFKRGEEPLPQKTSDFGSITITEFQDLASKEISVQGGELMINNTESPLNGFNLKVPSGAYNSDFNLKVTTADIVGHDLGDDFKILSPLISISGAPGGYAKGLITIDLPIKIAAGQFAAAVVVDANGNRDLLPMTLLSSDRLGVTTKTLELLPDSKRGRTLATGNLQFLIVGAEEDKLMARQYQTGFKPGEDDWAFVNMGSILAPGGYCSAASFSALWYFNNKKPETNKPLFQLGGSVNAPEGIRPDALSGQHNAAGIKYVSILQRLDSQLDETAKDYVSNVANMSKLERDKLIYCFASCYLQIVRKPLLLGMKHREPLGESWGHMIRIIGTGPDGLRLSDPNYPGVSRTLKFEKTTGFERYKAPLEAAKPFETDIYYALPPNLFDKDAKTEVLWPYFEDPSGDARIQFFPSFTYVVKSEGTSISENVITQSRVNKIRSPFTVEVTSDLHLETKTILCDAKGVKINLSTDYYILPSGQHKIGILVWQKDELDTDYNWADFRWFDVEVDGRDQDYEDCQLTTEDGISVEKPGETDKEYTFSLGTTCSFPQKTVFFWDFGDGSTYESVDKRIVKHKFAKTGVFAVRLRALPPGASNYVVKQLNIRIGNASQYFVRFKVGSSEYMVPRYTGDAISFNNHTYGTRRESWPSLLAIYYDRKGDQSYGAFLSIDFYNNAFKGVGDYTIAAPLNKDIMLSPYGSRTEFYASLPSKGPVLNAYITSFSGSSFLGKAGGNVKITKYERGNIIEGTFEFVGDEYINGGYTVRNETITGSFRIRPQFDN